MPEQLFFLQVIDEQTIFFFLNASWNPLEISHMAEKRAM